jgi:hypothetical protein
MIGPENLIFTACTGRCGQFSLVEYLNVFGEACLAEAEPPSLIYPNHWPLGNWLRHVQRRWIVTDEDLGRGDTLAWFDEDRREPLARLASRRIKRLSRLSRRAQARTYVEVSKFFIRSYCDAVADLRPDIGMILLRRDPLVNAKSFSNRGKNFRLDGVMPDFRKACLPMDSRVFSPFQLYLWHWAEIELRFQRFIEVKQIGRHYVMRTEDLNSPQRIKELFDYFSIDRIEPIVRLEPRNTNESKGREGTVVSSADLDEFDRFYDMLPADVRHLLPALVGYRESYAKAGRSQ